MKWRGGALLACAIVAVCALTPARGADGPLAPIQKKQSQTFSGASPACTFTQAWKKQPAILDVRSVALSGTATCDPTLKFGGGIIISDLLSNRRFSRAGYSVNGGLNLGGTWKPKVPGLYHFEFDLVFDPDGYYVGWPDECDLYAPDVDLVGGGPPTDWSDPYWGCTFTQDIFIPPASLL
jgi:hypothetical protein